MYDRAYRYVYALRVESTPFVKIGCSVRPEMRAIVFQCALRRRAMQCHFELVAQVPYSSMELYEKKVQKYLKDYRVHFEWFCATKVLIYDAMLQIIVYPQHGSIIEWPRMRELGARRKGRYPDIFIPEYAR